MRPSSPLTVEVALAVEVMGIAEVVEMMPTLPPRFSALPLFVLKDLPRFFFGVLSILFALVLFG